VTVLTEAFMTPQVAMRPSLGRNAHAAFIPRARMPKLWEARYTGKRSHETKLFQAFSLPAGAAFWRRVSLVYHREAASRPR